MKLFLLKMTALSAVVGTSNVHALSVPFVLRGSAQNEDVQVELEGTCAQGQKDGQNKVKRLWEKMDENCDLIWDLEDAAQDIKNDNYPRSNGSWRQSSYTRCARDGVDAQVSRIEEDCLSDPIQCQDLGDAAAEEIVFASVCSPQFDQASMHHHQPDWKAMCKEVAYGICRGEIYSVIKSYCPDSNVNTKRLLRLQNRCEDQIDSMVGGGDEVETM